MKTVGKKQSGFTIVELLIVTVVIAILAAISVVAYNRIQQRGRDAQRKNDVATLQKALELYHADNGGYPTCAANTTYFAGDPRTSCSMTDPDIVNALSPKYISKVSTDPLNVGDYYYFYVCGSRKVTDVTYSGSSDDNYVIGVHYESQGGPYVGSWAPQNFNYIAGSNN